MDTERQPSTNPEPNRAAVADERDAERGYVVALTALLLVPMLVFTAFATDVGAWYVRAQEIQRAADAAAAYGRLKQLDKENNLADFIRSQGVEIYTPDLEAFRTHVQAQYVGSEFAATWPEGVLEKINALGN